MQIESLKVFCDVARYRSFSQAAVANDVTQSAASQVVLQLEKRMRVQLIDRSTRPLQLTALGQVYYDGCKELVERYLELEASVRDASQRLAGTVQVAAIYSVGLGDMGKYVERFRSEQPGARVQLEYLHPDRVAERVQDGTADFGLVSFPRATREVDALPWREEEMVLVCPPGHSLAGQRSVRPGELERQRYIGFDRDLRIRREVDRFLRRFEVSVDIALEFDNIENIKKAVEIGAGVALLPEPTLQREVEAGTLMALPLAGCRFVRPLGIIFRRHHHLSATARGFLELLRRDENAANRTSDTMTKPEHRRKRQTGRRRVSS
jgi:DNA-binding transcriptional LysR family regulator